MSLLDYLPRVQFDRKKWDKGMAPILGLLNEVSPGWGDYRAVNHGADLNNEAYGLLGEGNYLGGASKLAQGVTEQLTALPLLGDVAMGAKLMAPAFAGIFMGRNSRTWDKGAEEVAEAMAEKVGLKNMVVGSDEWMRANRAIHQQTGTHLGPDGKWRQEIDDSGAKLRGYQYTPKEAFREAQLRSMLNEQGGEHVTAMRPYSTMTKSQLVDEYKRTGGEIVETAKRGDTEAAKQMNRDRSGLSGLLSQMADRKHGPFSNYMRHGELGAAYPDAYRMHMRIDPDEVDALGSYQKASPHRGEQIVVARKPTVGSDKETLLHEMQHGIQNREGFARGGNLSDARILSPDDRERVFSNIDSKLRELALKHQDGKFLIAGFDPNRASEAVKADPDFARLIAEREALKDSFDPMNQYRRLAGEAEARAVQKRMDYPASKRREVFPLDDYDVPVRGLLYR